MLTNFISDADLKKYHPKLANQIWSTQATYETQIDEAYQRVLTDLTNQEINPRLVMVHLDLVAVTGSNQFPTTSTQIVSTTGSAIEADRNYKRFVVNPSNVVGTWAIKLQGSNDSTTWEDVADASITATTTGKQSIVYEGQYSYWRYVNTKSSTGGSDTISYQKYLLETVFDKLIIYQSFIIIFSDFRKAPNDTWDLLVQQYLGLYNSQLKSIKFLYDADDSGTTTDAEGAMSTIPTFIM